MKAADFSVGLTYSVRKRMLQGRESSQLLEGHGVHHLPHVCEHTAVSQLSWNTEVRRRCEKSEEKEFWIHCKLWPLVAM